MPNTHDKLIDGAVKSHKTLSTHYTTDADTNPGRLQMQNKQVLGNDGTTNTTLHGYNQALNKWGFFVTKPGVEVTTNTDLSKFIFNSSQDMFKIVSKGTSTIPGFSFTPGNNGFSLVTIPHGLSFIPLVQVYVPGNLVNASLQNIATSYIPLPIYVSNGAIEYYFAGGGGNSYPLTVLFGIDNTNLYVEAFYANVGTGVTGSVNSIPVTYFLLQETAN